MTLNEWFKQNLGRDATAKELNDWANATQGGRTLSTAEVLPILSGELGAGGRFANEYNAFKAAGVAATQAQAEQAAREEAARQQAALQSSMTGLLGADKYAQSVAPVNAFQQLYNKEKRDLTSQDLWATNKDKIFFQGADGKPVYLSDPNWKKEAEALVAKQVGSSNWRGAEDLIKNPTAGLSIPLMGALSYTDEQGIQRTVDPGVLIANPGSFSSGGRQGSITGFGGVPTADLGDNFVLAGPGAKIEGSNQWAGTQNPLGALAPIALGLALGPAGLGLGSSLGLGSMASGALTGGLVSGLTGGDPLKGALMGGLGGGLMDAYDVSQFGAGEFGGASLPEGMLYGGGGGTAIGGAAQDWINEAPQFSGPNATLSDLANFGQGGFAPYSPADVADFSAGGFGGAAAASGGGAMAYPTDIFDFDFLGGSGVPSFDLGSLGSLGSAASGISKLLGGGSSGGSSGLNLGGLLGTAANLGGGYLNTEAAKEAAQIQANAQLEAAKLAADAAKFRPVGVSTRFGSSQFGFDDSGRLTSAGYTLTPEMRAQQDALMAQTGASLNQYLAAQGATAPMGATASSLMGAAPGMISSGLADISAAGALRPDIAALLSSTSPLSQQAKDQLALSGRFTGEAGTNLTAARPFFDQATGSIAATQGIGAAGQQAIDLGRGYLQKTPQEMAQQFMSEQQALLAPTREREYAALENRLRQQGRLGLATGAAGGLGAANPEMEALANARRMQDLQLAAQATQGGQQYAQFGSQLAGTGADLMSRMYGTQQAALQPYQGMLDTATGLASAGAQGAQGAGNLMRDVYGIQSAAFDPYKAALGVGQQQTTYGAGLMGTGGDLLKSMYGTQQAAFAPYETAFGGVKGIEALGQDALRTGMSLGSSVTAANAAAGNATAQGMQNAAQTMAGVAGSPWGTMLQGAGQALQNWGQPTQQAFKYDPYSGKLLGA